jgi:hypothetical protein
MTTEASLSTARSDATSAGEAFTAVFVMGLASDVGLRFGLRALIPGFDPNVFNVRSGSGSLYLRAYAIGSNFLFPSSLLCGLTYAGCIYYNIPAFVIILDLSFAELRGRHFTEYVRIRALDFRN